MCRCHSDNLNLKSELSYAPGNHFDVKAWPLLKHCSLRPSKNQPSILVGNPKKKKTSFPFRAKKIGKTCQFFRQSWVWKKVFYWIRSKVVDHRDRSFSLWHFPVLHLWSPSVPWFYKPRWMTSHRSHRWFVSYWKYWRFLTDGVFPPWSHERMWWKFGRIRSAMSNLASCEFTSASSQGLAS